MNKKTKITLNKCIDIRIGIPLVDFPGPWWFMLPTKIDIPALHSWRWVHFININITQHMRLLLTESMPPLREKFNCKGRGHIPFTEHS